MLECINKECGYCENGKCKDEIYINTACKGICKDRIEPTHIPNYAEEQLEHAKEKENRCYNEECPRNNKNGLCLLLISPTTECKDRNIEQPIPLNYEEEYYKLKAKNEELKKTLEDALKEKNWKVSTFTHYNTLKYAKSEYERINKNLSEELKNSDITNRNMQATIIELHEEMDQVIEEKEKYHTEMVILQEDNKEYKRANEGLAAESKERLQTIKKLQRQIEDNTENAILRNRVEDLEKELKSLKNTYNAKQTQWENEQVKQVEVLIKENTNLNELIEKKDIKIEKLEKEVESLKEVVNEENEQLTNEYSNKIIIAEQKINRLNTEVAWLQTTKEKADKRIQHLINAIKSMAAAL